MFGMGKRTDYDLEKDVILHKNDMLAPDMYQFMPLLSLMGFDNRVKKGIHMSHTVVSLWYVVSEETMEAFYFVLNTADVKIDLANPNEAYTDEGKNERFDNLLNFIRNNKKNIIASFTAPSDGNWSSYYHDSLPTFMTHPVLKKGRVFVRPLTLYLSSPYTTGGYKVDNRNLNKDCEITMKGRITLDDKTGIGNDNVSADLFRLSFKDKMGQTYTTFLFLGVDNLGEYWDEEELRKKFNNTNQKDEIEAFLRTNTYVPITQYRSVCNVMNNYLCDNTVDLWEVVFEQVYVSGELGLTDKYYQKNKK